MSKNWAICIGINEYKFVGKLQYARRNAQLMAQFCREELRFERVFYFAEGASEVETFPTRGQIIEASPRFGNLDAFLNIQFEQRDFLNPQDNLWFFFAGHGMRADGIDYLMPIDGNPKRIEQTGLKIHYLAERLRRCGAGNIVLMLDACRSGDSRDMGLEEGIGVEPQQGMVTLFSCGPNEKSYEIADRQQGAFTCAVLEGLRLNGPNNCATVDRLSQYVKRRVNELNAPSNQQTVSVKAEPIEKAHLVLLPDKATVRDVDPIKKAALNAEVLGDLNLARQLWIRVLAIIRADLEAIRAIERIAVKRAKLPQVASTLGLDGERTGAVSEQAEVTQRSEVAKQVEELTSRSKLSTFTFEVVTVDSKGKIADRVQRSAEYLTESINGVDLEMVLIPSGEFVMGSPEQEEGRNKNEGHGSGSLFNRFC